MSVYRVLDLFSGIGGFTLGLERTGGFKTVAFCETDTYCKRVLAKHWPGVPIYHDIRHLTAERLRADGIVCDVLTGGFPCQDISLAGKGAGIDGERSGLWSEYSRLIGELQPRFAIVENVAALLARGLDRILGDLAALGFDAEWHCIPASAIGAPHRRDRLWIVGYANGQGEPAGALHAAMAESLGNANGSGLAQRQADHDRSSVNGSSAIERAGWWLVEPRICRVAHGIPARVHRVRALGNAVVPQIPELIGRAILQAEAERP